MKNTLSKQAEILWRLLFTWIVTFLLNMVFNQNYSIFFATWIIIFGGSLIFIERRVIVQGVDLIMSDKFMNFAYYSKCIMFVAGLSIFFTLVVVTGYYKNAPDTPVNAISIALFIFFSGLLYMYHKLTHKTVPICRYTNKKDKKNA